MKTNSKRLVLENSRGKYKGHSSQGSLQLVSGSIVRREHSAGGKDLGVYGKSRKKMVGGARTYP